MLESGAEERLAWQKHHYVLWGRLKLCPVVFARKAVGVRSDLCCVLLQPCNPYRIIVRLDRFQICLEWHFGIHHNPFPAREMHNQIGAQLAIGSIDARLLLKVTLFHHARKLHNALKLDLSPLTAALRGPQRRDKICSLGTQSCLSLRHRLDLLRESRVSP